MNIITCFYFRTSLDEWVSLVFVCLFSLFFFLKIYSCAKTPVVFTLSPAVLVEVKKIHKIIILNSREQL